MRNFLIGFLINLGLGIFGILGGIFAIIGYVKLMLMIFPVEAMPAVIMITGAIVTMSCVFAPVTAEAFNRKRGK